MNVPEVSAAAREIIAGDDSAVGLHLAAVDDRSGRILAIVVNGEATVADGEAGEVVGSAAVLNQEAAAKHGGGDAARLEIAVLIVGAVVGCEQVGEVRWVRDPLRAG